MNKTYGLIGYPLGHSLSPGYFKEKFTLLGLNDHDYELFPLRDIDELPVLLGSRPDIAGLNVTIPYKEKVLKYVNSPDPEVISTGAANTLKIERKNDQISISAFNTDVNAFRKSLLPLLNKDIKNAMILGYGGAGKAVEQVFKSLSLPYIIISRNPVAKNMKSWSELNNGIVSSHQLIVQCTPIGLDQTDAPLPFPFDAIGTGHLLYDLIYNPSETKFLSEGRTRGAKTKNGLEMLHLQADESWNLWNS